MVARGREQREWERLAEGPAFLLGKMKMCWNQVALMAAQLCEYVKPLDWTL